MAKTKRAPKAPAPFPQLSTELNCKPLWDWLNEHRASCLWMPANLRNWFGFLTLRLDEHAQWEIRQFAGAVALFLAREFPRSFDLFNAAFTGAK